MPLDSIMDTNVNKPSIDKFNIKQMFNNSKGKTSGMLVVCIYACISAVTCFVIVAGIISGAAIYAVIHKDNLSTLLHPDIQALLQNLLMQASALFAMGGAGLGIRRYTPDKLPVIEDTTAAAA